MSDQKLYHIVIQREDGVMFKEIHKGDLTAYDILYLEEHYSTSHDPNDPNSEDLDAAVISAIRLDGE